MLQRAWVVSNHPRNHVFTDVNLDKVGLRLAEEGQHNAQRMELPGIFNMIIDIVLSECDIVPFIRGGMIHHFGYWIISCR